MRNVYRLIRQLGVTSKYKGYYYVAEAVRMFMEIQDHPIKITKDITLQSEQPRSTRRLLRQPTFQ